MVNWPVGPPRIRLTNIWGFKPTNPAKRCAKAAEKLTTLVRTMRSAGIDGALAAVRQLVIADGQTLRPARAARIRPDLDTMRRHNAPRRHLNARRDVDTTTTSRCNRRTSPIASSFHEHAEVVAALSWTRHASAPGHDGSRRTGRRSGRGPASPHRAPTATRPRLQRPCRCRRRRDCFGACSFPNLQLAPSADRTHPSPMPRNLRACGETEGGPDAGRRALRLCSRVHRACWPAGGCLCPEGAAA